MITQPAELSLDPGRNFFRVVDGDNVLYTGNRASAPPLRREKYHIDYWTGLYSWEGQKIFYNDFVLTAITHCGKPRKTMPNAIRMIAQIIHVPIDHNDELNMVCAYKHDKIWENQGDFRMHPRLDTVNEYNCQQSEYWRKMVEHLPPRARHRCIPDLYTVIGNFYGIKMPEEYELPKVSKLLATKFAELNLMGY